MTKWLGLFKKDSLVRRMAKNPKIVQELLQMYRKLCPACSAKARANPNTDSEDYCKKCQIVVRHYLERVAALMK